MRRTAVLVLAVLLCLLSGCDFSILSLPYARELENTALVRVLGVDISAGHIAGLTVTAAAAQKENMEKPTVLTGSAFTIPAAVLSLETQGTGKVILAYVGELLLGESAAQRSVTEALDYAMEDGTIGLDATVWVMRGTSAATAITGTGSISERLTALETDGGLAGIPISRSVKETAASLAETDCAFVPALTLRDDTLLPAGYAILRDGALLGYVDGGAACGVELLLGKVVRRIVEVETPTCAVAALEVSSAHTSVAPVFDGDTLAGLSINCFIKGKVAQLQGEAGLEELRAMLEEEERACALRTLTLAQGLKADFLGLEGRTVLSAPWHKAAIREQWVNVFPTLPITLTVTVETLT